MKHEITQISGRVDTLEASAGGNGGGIANDNRKENNSIVETGVGIDVTQPVADIMWDLSSLNPGACRSVAAVGTAPAAAAKGDVKTFRELQRPFRLFTDTLRAIAAYDNSVPGPSLLQHSF
ncbi:hypothetical protein JKP88DRAFT_273821 [Tribonema minus]|uniref:Uncharacterized protein n=1 Tax=Tribonema minus TaxID=303371 RepID=A0A836CAR1_9STRA|nr:hypothetical protein JKP88DRAFT_273821 [Tribonema minus]